MSINIIKSMKNNLPPEVLNHDKGIVQEIKNPPLMPVEHITSP